MKEDESEPTSSESVQQVVDGNIVAAVELNEPHATVSLMHIIIVYFLHFKCSLYNLIIQFNMILHVCYSNHCAEYHMY